MKIKEAVGRIWEDGERIFGQFDIEIGQDTVGYGHLAPTTLELLQEKIGDAWAMPNHGVFVVIELSGVGPIVRASQYDGVGSYILSVDDSVFVMDLIGRCVDEDVDAIGDEPIDLRTWV